MRGTVPHYPLDRKQIGPDLDTVRKRMSCPCRESNYSRPAFSPLLYRLSYSGSSSIPNFFISYSGVHTEFTGHVGHLLACCTCPGWSCRWRFSWNKDWQGKPQYSEKTCPSPTWSTTNSTWLNPDRRGGKPATNRLSYGAARLPFLSPP
jgi:hypothetical protein